MYIKDCLIRFRKIKINLRKYFESLSFLSDIFENVKIKFKFKFHKKYFYLQCEGGTGSGGVASV